MTLAAGMQRMLKLTLSGHDHEKKQSGQREIIPD